MSAPSIFPTPAWIQQVGWTLIQFLWQGTVIAILFAAARGLFGRSMTAQSRYTMAFITLTVMAVAPAITFVARPSAAPISAWPLSSPDSWQRVLPWCVAAWLIGVVLFSIRLIGGWRFTSRLRNYGVRPAPEEWQHKLEGLIMRMGVSRPVQLLVSSLVEVPTVIGWLRPLILVPVGALTGLPSVHVEALLIHELAHIRRLDYLMNMVQSITEAVLFYHPAVWWISDQIRSERELCCDDIAVVATGDVLTYVRALAEMESHRPVQSQSVMAANGGSLPNRIRRLIGQQPKTAHTLPGPGAAVVMSLLCLFGGSDGCNRRASRIAINSRDCPTSRSGIRCSQEAANTVDAALRPCWSRTGKSEHRDSLWNCHRYGNEHWYRRSNGNDCCWKSTVQGDNWR
jgi:beta-lactamase regulating signal transducer with metallopeptidase domain